MLQHNQRPNDIVNTIHVKRMLYSSEYLQTLLTTQERNTQEILLQTLGNYSRQGKLKIFTIFLCIVLYDDSHFIAVSSRKHSRYIRILWYRVNKIK